MEHCHFGKPEVDTASSGFFLNDLEFYSNDDRQLTTEFSELHELVNEAIDRSLLIKIQDKVNLLKGNVKTNELSMKQLDRRECIRQFVVETEGTLQTIKNESQESQTSIRKLLEKKVADKEREIVNMRAEWKILINNCENQIDQQIENLKEVRRGLESTLAASAKQMAGKLKNQMNELRLQVKDLKKEKSETRIILFDSLESMRMRLNQSIAAETQKRNEYDQIICGLLERACERAETAIRRVVY